MVLALRKMQSRQRRACGAFRRVSLTAIIDAVIANHAQLLFEIVGEDGTPIAGTDGKPVTRGVELGPAAAIAKQGVTVESFPSAR